MSALNNYKEVKQHTSGYSHALISWRLLPTDPDNISFDIYFFNWGIKVLFR